MKRLLFSTMLLFLGLTVFGQATDTVVTVSERFHYRYLREEPSIDQLQRDNEERQRSWQEDFEAMKASLGDADRISDNVRVTVTTEVRYPDLIVSVGYETVVISDAADDYALGKYAIENSRACTFMCNFLKSKMENEMASYLRPGTEVLVKVTGATDGTPIRSRIEYRGEYGDFEGKDIILNGNPHRMTVTRSTGITTNGQLAFLRTQGVEHFLKTQVEPLRHTSNTFEEYAVENQEMGGGYRRVSIEMTIRGAFTEVEPNNTTRP